MVYDTASTNETGLFSMWVDSHNVVHAHDTYHFVCTITRDAPLLATCTLTFEEPARPEGPAVDGELAGPRLATNPRHDDSCCVEQPLIVCAEPPLSNYLRRVIRSHRAIERFSLLS